MVIGLMIALDMGGAISDTAHLRKDGKRNGHAMDEAVSNLFGHFREGRNDNRVSQLNSGRGAAGMPR